MTQPYRIEPDLDFIRDVIDSGGDTVKKCFQCANCSVVCPLSPSDGPFPRKQMILSQWGLKDKLVKDPDIWLCHNCTDCSTYCPRGAKPGDVLNALRKKAIEYYSYPSVVAKMVGDKKALPLLFGIPAAFLLLVIFFTNHFGEAVYVAHGHEIAIDGLIRSWKMIPILAVDIIYVLTATLVLLVFARGIINFWKDMDQQRTRTIGIIPAAIDVIKDIITHNNFKECGTNQDRYLGHLWLFYGFIACFITTSCIVVAFYVLGLFMDISMTPWSIWNPVKILGNLGGIAILGGCFLVVQNRLNQDQDTTTTSYYDWFLIGIVVTIGASGMLIEILRWLNIAVLYYPVYFVHLVAVWGLFAYAPYGKMAHIVYRTVALIHSRACGRELTSKAPVISLSITEEAAPATEEAVAE